VPSKADEYREKAQECARNAKAAYDPVVKKTLEELERHWLQMAERAERYEL
jgi:hypothetical protein